MNKKRVLILTIIITISILIFDYYDRENFAEKFLTKEHSKDFFYHKTTEDVENAFAKNYGNPKYNFSKNEISKIKIYSNDFLISRITGKKFSEKQKNEIIDFFNNQENFDFGETTWELNEAEYILRFYNKDGNEMNKIWLCLKDCGMTFSKKFSPNMKFGGMSERGRLKISKIINLE
jgi:hypothetical protein